MMVQSVYLSIFHCLFIPAQRNYYRRCCWFNHTAANVNGVSVIEANSYRYIFAEGKTCALCSGFVVDRVLKCSISNLIWSAIILCYYNHHHQEETTCKYMGHQISRCCCCGYSRSLLLWTGWSKNSHVLLSTGRGQSFYRNRFKFIQCH